MRSDARKKLTENADHPSPTPPVGRGDQPEQWIEWGVRRTWGAVGTVARLDRRTAEACAREWPGELVRRTVTASAWETADV